MNIKTLIVVCIISLLTIATVSIIVKNESKQNERDIIKETMNDLYTPNNHTLFKNDFMEGCTEDVDSNYSYCSCAYDYIVEQDNGFESLIELSLNIATGKELSDKQADLVISTFEYCN